MDFDEKSITKQTQKSRNKHAVGFNDSCGSRRKIRYWRNNTAIPTESQMPRKYVVRQTELHEQVYDLINAGPNHCFAVLSNSGVMLVHNCVQAVARDCLAIAIERLEAAGYPIVFHVHDEVVIDCPSEKADLDNVVKIMTMPIEWAPGLPINADGWVGDFFRKD